MGHLGELAEAFVDLLERVQDFEKVALLASSGVNARNESFQVRSIFGHPVESLAESQICYQVGNGVLPVAEPQRLANWKVRTWQCEPSVDSVDLLQWSGKPDSEKPFPKWGRASLQEL